MDKSTQATSNLDSMARPVNQSRFECGCCFGEYHLKTSVACGNGHLFCRDCIKRFVESISFDAGKSSLTCLNTKENCEATFSIKKLNFIEPKIIENLEERQQKDELVSAFSESQNDKLHKCPFCGFSCIVEPAMQIFFCIKCERSSCQYCNVTWEKHFEYGYVCDEVEGDDESKIRRKTEEAMTSALVRKCPKCDTLTVKADGCNKMTCRCLTIFCYLCHQVVKDGYKHFCDHEHRASQKCPSCKKCSLWYQPNDVARIEDERLRGETDRENIGAKNKKKIGGEIL